MLHDHNRVVLEVLADHADDAARATDETVVENYYGPHLSTDREVDREGSAGSAPTAPLDEADAVRPVGKGDRLGTQALELGSVEPFLSLFRGETHPTPRCQG